MHCFHFIAPKGPCPNHLKQPQTISTQRNTDKSKESKSSLRGFFCLKRKTIGSFWVFGFKIVSLKEERSEHFWQFSLKNHQYHLSTPIKWLPLHRPYHISDHTQPEGQKEEKRFDCVVYTRQTSSPPSLRERSVSSFPEVPPCILRALLPPYLVLIWT